MSMQKMDAVQQEGAQGEEKSTETRVGRRSFTADYKRRVLAEAARCKRGELGLLLRREGLYSSTLEAWRKQLSAGQEGALMGKKRGRPTGSSKTLNSENACLQKENARLQEKLRQAELIIEVQKKLCSMLGLTPAEEAH